MDNSPPKNREDTIEIDAVYHNMPPQPNNYRKEEILACVAHRLRAHHGISAPADIILYDGQRQMYEHLQHVPAEMTDQPRGTEQRAYLLYDEIAEEAGLMIPRTDGGQALAYYNETQNKWAQLDQECKDLKAGTGIPEDIDKYGKLKAEQTKCEEVMNVLSWNGTAKVGYICARATPRNAGKLFLRCSDPSGDCYGQIPVESADRRLEFSCGWPFLICQRCLTPAPPDGSEVEIRYINQRIKREYGTTKCAKQLYDDEGINREGQYE